MKQLWHAPEIQCLFPKPYLCSSSFLQPLLPENCLDSSFSKKWEIIGPKQSCDLQTRIISMSLLFQTLSFVHLLSTCLWNLCHTNPSRSLLSHAYVPFLPLCWFFPSGHKHVQDFPTFIKTCTHVHTHIHIHIWTSKQDDLLHSCFELVYSP